MLSIKAEFSPCLEPRVLEKICEVIRQHRMLEPKVNMVSRLVTRVRVLKQDNGHHVRHGDVRHVGHYINVLGRIFLPGEAAIDPERGMYAKGLPSLHDEVLKTSKELDSMRVPTKRVFNFKHATAVYTNWK